nr:AraC family transcriptional regulator [uncultured Albidiferax sp.]
MPAQPWINEKIYAPYKLAALVETLVELGIPPSMTLQGTGLEALDVENPETLTSVGQYFTACRNAVRASRSPETPFLVGQKMHLSAYGMYGYALMCSLTLRDFFNEGVKYHKLATPTVAIEWREQDCAAIWSFPRLVAPELSADLFGFLVEQQLVQHAIHLHDVAGPDCQPQRALLSYPAPAHEHLYAQYLGCPVYFGSEACELHYDAAILDRPTQLAHKLTSALMQATCERLIGQAKTSVGISGQVYQILMASPGQLPGMEDVAAMVHMNERTMRRKLESEDTSFGRIMDDVRASLAREYLKTTKMTTEDIAALVGFSDAANFRRAFKRWTGKAPRDYRA